MELALALVDEVKGSCLEPDIVPNIFFECVHWLFW
jgi:hypothetical protein